MIYFMQPIAGPVRIGYVPSEDAPSAVASVIHFYGGTEDKPTLGVNFVIELEERP
jgi:hypothetical protein